ncbi:PAS domain-containing protein [Veillonella sp.]|uniref:helix-turn-helix transcriptional regulator n=1 Tax=Veillonella sp. TaxID=1926307 RepID=UPI0025DB7A01|nr:PAS domain-containing protein [Veillonella sp.]
MNEYLKSYFPVADIISNTFGNCCEVVVHDLTTPESSVVYVANGDITNRRIGQSFDHLVRQVLLNKKFKNDSVSNYYFEGPNGSHIKSSSALVRDPDGNVVGMICINIATNLFEELKSFIDSFLSTEKEAIFLQEEEVQPDVMSVIDSIIAKTIGAYDPQGLSRKKSVEIIKFLDEKGIFLVKGAIDKVASLMGVSKVTIYSYLDEAKGKR